MNIKLDKDDLFRNAVPGYVFLVVITSFYAALGKLDKITDVAQTILVVVAGFPLGFVIHYIYRFFHIFLREQRRMEAFEAELITERLNEDIVQSLRLDNEPTRRNRELSQLFELFLCASENKTLKDRNHFLIMRVHSLSGAIVAMLIAPCLIAWFKYPGWGLSYPWTCHGWIDPTSQNANLVWVLWLITASFFWMLRQNANEAYQLSMRRIIVGFWPHFRRFIRRTAHQTRSAGKGKIDI